MLLYVKSIGKCVVFLDHKMSPQFYIFDFKLCSHKFLLYVKSTGNCVVFLDHKDKPKFTSLRHLFSVRQMKLVFCCTLIKLVQVLPKKDFVELANHIICGDQVIIRGSDMVTVTSLLMVLKVLPYMVCTC